MNASADSYTSAAAPLEPARESLWFYLLLALLGTAGFFYVNIAAAMVDGMIGSLGFSNTQAGTVMSANIYGTSLGGLAAVFMVRHYRWRPTLMALFGALLVLDGISMFVHSYPVMLGVRAIDGVVGGASVGVALSLLGRTQNPDRAFGMLLAFQFGCGGLAMLWLPTLVAEHGAYVLFITLASMTLLALLVTSRLRVPGPPPARLAAAAHTPVASRWRLVAVVMLALFLFQAGNMALFAFIIPLGQSFGLGLEFISRTLAWATWVGILGAVMVIVMGTKKGRVRPLLAAMTLTVVGVAILAWSQLPVLFFVANAGTAITWAFVVPLLFGMISVVDPSGRLTTLAGFMSGLGLATGPMLAGLVAHTGNYVLLIGVAVALLILSSVATLSSAQRVDAMDRDRLKEESRA